jgi:putative spermidine/putrescine transport system substrate-binding protein
MTHRKYVKVLAVVFLVMLFAVISGTARHGVADARPQANRLVIAGYGGLTAPLQQKYFFDPFAKETGIDVQVLIVPGQQVAGISAQNAAKNIQWDLTIGLADTDMSTLLSKGYLDKMPRSTKTYIKQFIPGVRDWGVPSKRGAVMIGCNYKLATKCPTSPKQFFDTKNYPGPRALPSFQPLVAIALALEADGVKPSDVFPASLKKSKANIERAIAKLNTIKSSMKAFYSSSTTALQLLNAGEVTMGGFWNTINQNAYLHPSNNLQIGATWNGAATYSQWDVVYKGAPDEANAWKFIEWLYRHPDNVAQYSEAATSGTADPRAFAKLSPKVKQWLPANLKTRPPSVDTNPIWYIRSPAQKKMIDDFWTNFTNG